MTEEERNQLVEDNMSLVQAIINREFSYFANNDYTIEREDLYQSGCIGLIKASKKFDPSKNVKFDTYAYYAISNEIKDYIKSLRDKDDNFIEQNMDSLDRELPDNDETLGSITPDPKSNIWETDIDIRSSYMDVLESIERNEKTVTEKDVMYLDYLVQGYLPKDISFITGDDADDINLRLTAIKRKIRSKYEDDIKNIVKK